MQATHRPNLASAAVLHPASYSGRQLSTGWVILGERGAQAPPVAKPTPHYGCPNDPLGGSGVTTAVTVCPGARPVYGVSQRNGSALHQPTRPQVLGPPDR